MKASVSGLPEGTSNSQLRNSQIGSWFLGSWKLQAGLIAAAYLTAHLPFLAPSLEDYDSINFALGLRDFDPSRHQPHPPGSPVYIALGRIAYAVVNVVAPAATRPDTEAWALALLSAIGGAVAIVAFAAFCWLAAPPERRGAVPWAATIFAVSPLMWISGLRPMSDTPGLAAALAAQALMLHGRTSDRSLILGALLAGLAMGIRVQTAWLTIPLLFVVLLRRGFPWRPIAVLAAGGIAWAIPLVVDSGGLDGYLRALGTQAGEDFAWVNMLWLEPTPRRLAFVLYETFVLPWGSNMLAAGVAIAAAAGLVLAALRAPAMLTLFLLAFVPYIAFHMLFQETITVRYALPAVPLLAWLIAYAAGGSRRWTPIIAAPVTAAALLIAVPTGVAYGREPHPAFQAVARATTSSPRAAAVYGHHSVWRALQASELPLVASESPRLYEWLGPTEYWRSGGEGTVWFFADPRRTDLALIDPHARTDVIRYRWAVASRPELSGVRPAGADWYRIRAPGWFATEGWSLTPETGGLASVTGKGPDQRPIEAWVRRRPGPMHIVVGGRHLGEPGDAPLEFELSVDGVSRDRWMLTFEDRNFFRFLDLPGGMPGDGYGRITIAARAPSAARTPPGAVRQFDVQSTERLIYGFAEGWHEDEYDPATGRRWRWTSGRSVLRLKGAAGDVAVVMRGESPLRYFDAPPDVQVMAGGRVIARMTPSDDFEWTVRVPAADLAAGGSAIAIETRPLYKPGVVEGTADERELGLRLFECRVFPVSD